MYPGHKETLCARLGFPFTIIETAVHDLPVIAIIAILHRPPAQLVVNQTLLL
ncbi:hypothetical protein DSUL_20519 [Desulfovibrionales bacterium]